MHVWSIGYQGRSLDGLCAALAEAGVMVLLDVRDRAWSQRPEFRKGRLRDALEESGIRYEHFREAGNPYRPRRGEVLDFDECARKYRSRLDGVPEILDDAVERIEEEPAAVFCYESHRDFCHRGVLIQALGEKVGDLEVHDL
jgi:uncharacterized protein (DUF488 family)